MQEHNPGSDQISESRMIGAYLKHLREEIPLSQEDVVKKLMHHGVKTASVAMLSRIESGDTQRPRYDTKRALLHLHGIDEWKDLISSARAWYQSALPQDVSADVLPTPDAAYSRIC